MLFFLPFFLLLFNVGVGFIQPTSFAKYLPFVAILTLGACLRFKTLGLAGSYLLLTLFLLYFTPEIPYAERLWHWGTLFSHALTLYIFLLSVEEVESCWFQLESDFSQKTESLLQIQSTLASTTTAFDEREKEFIEEIKKLKEEAEQRKIERTVDLQHMQCIRSEIELLSSQKDIFIEDARRARAEALSYLAQLEASKTLKAENGSLQNQVYTVEAESKFENLQEEFATTTQVLKLQLEEAQHLKMQNLTLKEELHLMEQKLASEQIKMEEFQALQHEMTQRMQEGILTLQSKISTGNQKALSKAEGLYKQLRDQFNEKSHILAETRKELFQLEGESFVHSRESIERGHQRTEIELYLEKNQSRLMGEIEMLQAEISHLEELISRILNL